MTTIEQAQHALNVAKIRAWMSEDGSAPKRGRISRETVLAYNAATGESLPVPEVAPTKARNTTVTVYGHKVRKDGKRQAVVFDAPSDTVRQTLREAGETVGNRGRFSAAQLQRFIDLTTGE